MVVFNYINFIKIENIKIIRLFKKMYQTCYYHLYVYENIVETDYYISNERLNEENISKNILKKYKNEINKNQITDFKIEIFHIQIYNDSYMNIIDLLDMELEIIQSDFNLTNKYKKTTFDFSDLRDALDCL